MDDGCEIMNKLEICIEEISKSSYKAHIVNTNVQHEFNFIFDFAKKQELEEIMKGISEGETNADFTSKLKKYGNTYSLQSSLQQRI